MKETDWAVWAIAFVFFLPMHIGGPLVYLAIQQGQEIFRARLRGVIIGSVITATLGFATAIIIWPHSKAGAGTAIAVTLLYPWIDILRKGKSL
ncbi:MAG: hypothetical protein V7709_13675 [Halioglobus sp.]